MPRARVSLSGRTVHLGVFDTEEECARARAAAEAEKVRVDPRGRGPEYSRQVHDRLVAAATAAVAQHRQIHLLVDALPPAEIAELLAQHVATASAAGAVRGDPSLLLLDATPTTEPPLHAQRSWHPTERMIAAPLGKLAFAEPDEPVVVDGQHVADDGAAADGAADGAPAFNPKSQVERLDDKAAPPEEEAPPPSDGTIVTYSPLRARLSELHASALAWLTAWCTSPALTPRGGATEEEESVDDRRLVPYSPARACLSRSSKWLLLLLPATLLVSAVILTEAGTFAHAPATCAPPAAPFGTHGGPDAAAMGRAVGGTAPYIPPAPPLPSPAYPPSLSPPSLSPPSLSPPSTSSPSPPPS
eukprot:6164881-Prymnesium_polylepis.1